MEVCRLCMEVSSWPLNNQELELKNIYLKKRWKIISNIIMKTDGIVCVYPLHKFLILDSAWSIRILMSSLKYFQILKLIRLSELTFCWLESSFFVRHMTRRQLETHHWHRFSCNDFQCSLLIFWSLVHKCYNNISLMNFHGETYSLIFW